MLSPRQLSRILCNKGPYVLLETLTQQASASQDYSWLFAEPLRVLTGNIHVAAQLDELRVLARQFALAGAVAYDGEFTLGVFERWACWEQQSNSWCEGADFVRELQQRHSAQHAPDIAPEPLHLQPLWDKQGFMQAVEQAKHHIARGDIYQINLSQAFAGKCSNRSHFELYELLCRHSPAPMAGLLQFDEFEIISSSPELFVEISDGIISTKPIKGTRPRGSDTQSDLQMQQELLQSPKERAELVMITDLLRNDLGQISDYGSVQVDKLCALESFSQVHHLVSTVSGHLRPQHDCWSALQACFPGGSITGAPKCMAMRLIEKLEAHPRGYYTGCMGFSLPDGRAKFNILIRSLIRHGQNLSYHVGAGIVADSDALAEYEETLAKAKGIEIALDALGQHYT